MQSINSQQSSPIPTQVSVVLGKAMLVKNEDRLLYRRDSVIRGTEEIGFIQNTSGPDGTIISISHCGSMAVFGNKPEWIEMMIEVISQYDSDDEGTSRHSTSGKHDRDGENLKFGLSPWELDSLKYDHFGSLRSPFRQDSDEPHYEREFA